VKNRSVARAAVEKILCAVHETRVRAKQQQSLDSVEFIVFSSTYFTKHSLILDLQDAVL
jgi:hypothetical protein